MNNYCTHGDSTTRFYNTWNNMKKRVASNHPSRGNSYKDSGIVVCLLWDKYENFKADMYDSYIEHVKDFGEKDTTLDRIENNNGYYLDNCRWATYAEQNCNKRSRSHA